METKITTITDAIHIIENWTERYNEQPTDAQVRSAAHKLVDYIGGYGKNAGGETTVDFDLDAALEI